MNISGLVCPVTKLPLTKISDGVLTTADGRIGYPINDQIPVLLGPEAITDKPWSRDLKSPQYAEAYSEMEFYNKVGREHAGQINSIESLETSSSHGMRHIAALSKLTATELSSFPHPSNVWLFSAIDVAAERDCYGTYWTHNAKTRYADRRIRCRCAHDASCWRFRSYLADSNGRRK